MIRATRLEKTHVLLTKSQKTNFFVNKRKQTIALIGFAL